MRNLKNLGTTLSRNEMRTVTAGLSGPFKASCDSNCRDNSDCDCVTCNSGNPQYCASLTCLVQVDGIFNKSYKKCSCG